MVKFSKLVWHKAVCYTLQQRYDRQWKKCLNLSAARQIGKLATEFRKSELIRARLEEERRKVK
jgi:hypothetical protein